MQNPSVVRAMHGAGVTACLFSLFTLLAQGQAASLLKVLRQSQVGSTIEDGIGFGDIRVGTSKAELLKKWGATEVNDLGIHAIYQYLLDSGEAVLVRVKDDKVIAIIFTPTLKFSLPSKLKTLKGISIGTSFERVRTIYGAPDSANGEDTLYVGRGIGFNRDAGLVAAIIIFEPEKPPQ
jgi:hypothetical protein